MSAIHLIRHAKAKNRLTWEEPDHLRPLTKRGDGMFSNGENAGQRFQTRADFTYY